MAPHPGNGILASCSKQVSIRMAPLPLQPALPTLGDQAPRRVAGLDRGQRVRRGLSARVRGSTPRSPRDGQRGTVSGFTNRMAFCQLFTTLETATTKPRSNGRNLGYFTFRLAATSCWRSRAISASNSSRLLTRSWTNPPTIGAGRSTSRTAARTAAACCAIASRTRALRTPNTTSDLVDVHNQFKSCCSRIPQQFFGGRAMSAGERFTLHAMPARGDHRLPRGAAAAVPADPLELPTGKVPRRRCP